jgi:hypothetical protein
MKKVSKARRRLLTPMQVAQQQQGGEYIAPGAWLDRTGALHFSVPEILAHLGIPDTPDDRAFCVQVIREMLAREIPSIEIIQQDETTDG